MIDRFIIPAVVIGLAFVAFSGLYYQLFVYAPPRPTGWMSECMSTHTYGTCMAVWSHGWPASMTPNFKTAFDGDI